jgi:hypothetical protein
MYGKCLVNGKEAYYSCSGTYPASTRVCPKPETLNTKTLNLNRRTPGHHSRMPVPAQES